MRTYSLVVAVACWCGLMTLAGCSPKPIAGDPPPLPAGGVHDDHGHEGHDHGHHHGHSHADLGPNQGHLLELGDEQYHAEWVHDDVAGKLTVYILDSNAKNLVPIAAETITIEKKVGDRSDTYELAAVDRQGETPKTAKFEIVDKGLIEGLKLAGDGVQASIIIDINGQPFTAQFEKHSHDHHGHKH